MKPSVFYDPIYIPVMDFPSDARVNRDYLLSLCISCDRVPAASRGRVSNNSHNRSIPHKHSERLSVVSVQLAQLFNWSTGHLIAKYKSTAIELTFILPFSPHKSNPI